uniref:ATP synthase subunit d, mitochondrial n=1 Tax=Tabanus bromius TaxID=304241 RepID=A0A0K8TNX3_TABBR
MATKRIVQSAVNWAAIAERVPANQKPQFMAFKSKSDQFLRSVLANPETPPKIDWAYYKNNVAVAGLVDNFQKQYDALKIPRPADTVTSKIEEEEKATKSEIASYVQKSNDRIVGFQKNIDHLKSLLPYDQMTMEDYRDAFPEDALDPINRPTFWPHTPEEQVGYVNKDAQHAEHH